MTEQKLKELLADMTLEEKVNQMSQVVGAFYDTIFGSIDFCRIMVYDEAKCIVWEEGKWNF